ncbi:Substrate-binding region of ABC-type glycine betaine transport system [Photobacterium marinum]|uniref:Substrate-binding region of ABC-type glycine betaine transport system n=1 Tax=Photobacterium marinum TaxID=1056511 RepID=L8JEZ6_9GAMM|nr:glycine betaine ABC transporter substrate-binding protein [Photobacterium marinum]ELR67441.1 Substrate-binding region of ABC-type glycine betaine transport system [Photobacterium marinum]
MTFISRMMAAVVVLAMSQTAVAANKLVVGGKGFTEQLIMSSMTAQYLQAKGYEVDQRDGMGSTVLRTAQENGQIDLYWEYTGTGLITYNKVTDKLSPEETYNRVKSLDAKKGLIWLNPSKANNTYALAMRKDFAKEKGLETISDMMAWLKSEDGKDALLASNIEFSARADGLKSLLAAYEFELPRRNLKKMNSGLVYQALSQEVVDISMVFATDGRVKAFNFYVLKDDRQHFPNYALTPVVRQDSLDANPLLADQLNALAALMNDDVMASLNAQVDVDGISIERVAHDFLQQNNLL